jgi:hypothetical protein
VQKISNIDLQWNFTNCLCKSISCCAIPKKISFLRQADRSLSSADSTKCLYFRTIFLLFSLAFPAIGTLSALDCIPPRGQKSPASRAAVRARRSNSYFIRHLMGTCRTTAAASAQRSTSARIRRTGRNGINVLFVTLEVPGGRGPNKIAAWPTVYLKKN